MNTPTPTNAAREGERDEYGLTPIQNENETEFRCYLYVDTDLTRAVRIFDAYRNRIDALTAERDAGITAPRPTIDLPLRKLMLTLPMRWRQLILRDMADGIIESGVEAEMIDDPAALTQTEQSNGGE